MCNGRGSSMNYGGARMNCEGVEIGWAVSGISLCSG